MNTTRREFMQKAGTSVLAASALGAAATQLPSLDAQTSPIRNSPSLVVIYLRGGADMLGVINPYGDKDYTRFHPTIAVPGPDSNSPNKTLVMDKTFGLNPNMKTLYNMFQKDLMVPVVCSGSPHPTRSHFDAQDFMERGAPGNKNVVSGWLNRYLWETKTARDSHLRAFSLQSLLPRSLRGPYPVLARPDSRADLAMKTFQPLYSGTKKMDKILDDPNLEVEGYTGKQALQIIEALGARTIEQLTELNLILEKSPPSTANYPNSGLARQLRDIAKVIKSRRGMEVTALDTGGWDQHINEGPVDGAMANLVRNVSDSISAFFDDLGPQLTRKTMVLVMSEFGRTARENANRGTDHGRGGFMFVVGGELNGKQVCGSDRYGGLKTEQGNALPVLVDFRMVFADILNGLFKFDGFKRRGYFPEYRPSAPVNIMKTT